MLQLTKADIRALAGVCVTLRKVFGPLMEFKVTVMLYDSPSYTLRKALAITRTSTILDSVVEININTTKNDSVEWDNWEVVKIPRLLSPALYTLVNAIPAMRQLRTIHMSKMAPSRTNLYTILSSPYLVHLTLEAVQIPKIRKFPPLKLRKLALIKMSSWAAVQPLISQLAPSLEYLEWRWCKFRPLHQLQLPPFPRLLELYHGQISSGSTVPNESNLTDLLRLGSQLTHLHLRGDFRHTLISAFPASLQHLYISDVMLTERRFGNHSLPSLMSLSLQCYRGIWHLNERITLHSFISNHFPGITALHLIMPWSHRNFALLMARSQPNVHALELYVNAGLSLECSEERERKYGDVVEVPTDYLREGTLPAALQTLKLEIVQTAYNLEQSVACCARWIDDNVLPSGLSGSNLKIIDVSFIRPETAATRERMLWRRWVKSPNDYWQMEK